MVSLSVDHGFTAYGPSHWVVLGLFAAGAATVVVVGRRQRSRRFPRAFAAVVLGLQVGIHVYLMLPPRWDVRSSLPLQLSDLAGPVAAWALWSGSRWAFALTYYWGLTLSVQALVTPVLRVDFPDVGFLLFWATHLFVVWAAVYLTWGLRRRPGWRDYRLAVLVTVTWAAAVFALNVVLGSNYGYLNRKPATASVLDLLGDWPWYLVPEAAAVLGVWALMTWPWTRTRTA
ncbi:YwaF family protein [Saccharothrix hoggarensis]|uniref:TIGR02206 family membrane protein n=1 Tax=Saccharothrix hoggarensis TaxID=913853 RepID=A0ABW3R182_9PSEU